ncbi:hypothetical protein B296_00044194 [Ensete ventricosum]|uniref:Transposase (putative) gypsy type domain-containing protein n=1 Tax=Ensete ventricosum TaxID=4639 RepID=A0A426X301_ENSVE|nr:hypothetical protein B296_00044194 [Ensete ventricosum]
MKADHDLDTAVTEGSLAVIRERYSIPAEYGLHVPQPGQRPFSSDVPDMCILVDALEVGLRFSLHPLIEECLRWWRISPSQVAPNSWRYLVVFLGECRGAGIIPTRDLFMACFRLCKNRGGYYLIARVGFRVSGAPSNNKGWKSHYLFVSGPVWGFRLDWSAHPIGNAPPYLYEEEFILVGRLKGILSSLRAIKEMTELWLVKAGLSPAFRDRMDLGELRGMPKVYGGKGPSTRTAAPTREVVTSPARETPKASSKRPIDASTEQVDDPAQRPKKVKKLTRRHKSQHGEGETRSRSKGKEPATPSEELETPVESDEWGTSPVHHRPRSMKDLFKTKVHKDDAGYYTLYMSDLGHQDPDKEMKARWRGLKNSMKIWNDSSTAEEFERRLLHPQLARELYTLPSEVLLARAAKEMVLMMLFDRVHDTGRLITFMNYRISNLQWELDSLKSGGGPEAVAKAKERASELEQELGKTKQERDEALQWLKASEKELTKVRSNLAENQRLLKEARVRARKIDDELLQSVKALESVRSELPKQAVDRYKESADFKEGLKWMGRVTYEYGYRVALARFRALHPDSEVEEDPFTIHPEDDLVPMKRQQAFDDSDLPES